METMALISALKYIEKQVCMSIAVYNTSSLSRLDDAPGYTY
jgi:hypothetical protein